MSRKKKIVLGALLAPLLLVGTCASAVALRKNRTFDGPMPDIKASTDPALLERGKYLVYGPAHCGTCHGDNANEKAAFAGEEVALAGGFLIDIPPGKFWAPNITPDEETGIGKTTDGELARALRYGIGRDGRALFPFMPFQNMSDEDLTAVISYLRAQKPVKKPVSFRKMSFIGDVIAAFVLTPEGPSKAPPKAVKREATAEYGRYLAEDVANCKGCHTDRDMKSGKFIGVPFAGGMIFEAIGRPDMELVTPNLTPDEKTGRIATWSEEQFVQRMRSGAPGAEGTHMPWGSYKWLSEDDAKALYRFLMSLPPTERDTGPSLRAKKK